MTRHRQLFKRASARRHRLTLTWRHDNAARWRHQVLTACIGAWQPEQLTMWLTAQGVHVRVGYVHRTGLIPTTQHTIVVSLHWQ